MLRFCFFPLCKDYSSFASVKFTIYLYKYGSLKNKKTIFAS
jgi:hypothetical protein